MTESLQLPAEVPLHQHTSQKQAQKPYSRGLVDAMIAEIRREFPRFRMVRKRDSRLQKVIHQVLRLMTFGAQNRYLSHYHTVLGYTLYVPDSWDETDELDRVITLRHERVHLRQVRRYSLLGMAFLYLIPFFPIGLAYGRARLEWEAYVESLRATAEFKGLEVAKSQPIRNHIVQRFTGADYAWMWPFPGMVNSWFDLAIHTIAEQMPHHPR